MYRSTLTLMIFCFLFPFLSRLFAKTYTVGIDENNFLPYYQASANGNLLGFTPELLNLFAKSQGITLKYIIFPAKRLQLMQNQNLIDLRFPDSPEWAAKDKENLEIVYSNPVVAYRDGVYQLVGSSRSNIGEKQPYRLAILRGFTPFGLESLINEGTFLIEEVSSYSAALVLMKTKRVDGIYGNEAVIDYWNRKENRIRVALNKNFPFVKDYQRLSTISHSKLIESFNQWISARNPAIEKVFVDNNLLHFK